jgi:hypothetical protein
MKKKLHSARILLYVNNPTQIPCTIIAIHALIAIAIPGHPISIYFTS